PIRVRSASSKPRVMSWNHDILGYASVRCVRIRTTSEPTARSWLPRGAGDPGVLHRCTRRGDGTGHPAVDDVRALAHRPARLEGADHADRHCASANLLESCGAVELDLVRGTGARAGVHLHADVELRDRVRS